ncbi:MAG TPA: redoxin family protein [Thermoplasmata archaeon]|nr:redoxin family protein [Thermoplasmata archaeon]
MPVRLSQFKVPPLEGAKWLQGGAMDVHALRGKRALLVDFWDYTCVNCIRTLPYIQQWHERYDKMGLTVVGVHSPEFAFAKSADFVGSAVKRFGLTYPIAVDSDFAIWNAFENKFWPAKYLVDRNGFVIYEHFGEGSYQQTEELIQEALRPLNKGKEFPIPIAPIREEDAEGSVCYPVSPELYCGYKRGTLGNKSGYIRDSQGDYKDPGMRREEFLYLEGRWSATEEYVEFLGPRKDVEPYLAVRFKARGVNLVMSVSGRVPVELGVELDGSPPKKDEVGEDVRLADGQAVVKIDEPRMYQLLMMPEVSEHELRLKVKGKGLRAYAFTFTSCIAK